jgi:hypothetical protein
VEEFLGRPLGDGSIENAVHGRHHFFLPQCLSLRASLFFSLKRGLKTL